MHADKRGFHLAVAGWPTLLRKQRVGRIISFQIVFVGACKTVVPCLRKRLGHPAYLLRLFTDQLDDCAGISLGPVK